MSIKVNYKGAEILSYDENGTKTLKTGGKYCEDDITIVNTQDGGITPTGTIEITENGTYDVTENAEAVVNVASCGSGIIFEEVDAEGHPTTINFSDCPLFSYTSDGYTTNVLPYLIGRNYGTVSPHLYYATKYIISNDTTGITSYQFGGANIEQIAGTENVKFISASCFNGCTKLKTIDTSKVEYFGGEAFRNNSKLENVSFASAKYIGGSLFNGDANFKGDNGKVVLPSTVYHIDNWVFNSAQLQEIVIKGTPATINVNAFGGMNSTLTSIKVAWAEGEVANAPWGATNATITYNYTGE